MNATRMIPKLHIGHQMGRVHGWVIFSTAGALVVISVQGRGLYYFQTLPKAQRTRGLSSFCQSKFLRSYHKFKHKSASTKNLNQTSASPQNLKFKILTKPRPRLNFITSTKHQRQNTVQTSTLVEMMFG